MRRREIARRSREVEARRDSTCERVEHTRHVSHRFPQETELLCDPGRYPQSPPSRVVSALPNSTGVWFPDRVHAIVIGEGRSRGLREAHVWLLGVCKRAGGVRRRV